MRQSQSDKSPHAEYVYLIRFIPYKGDRSHRCYKIGRSVEPDRRRRELDTSLPGDVQIEHVIETDNAVATEQFWHELLQEDRIRGTNEWFDLDREKVEEFLEITGMWFKPEGLQIERSRTYVDRYRRELREAGVLSDD